MSRTATQPASTVADVGIGGDGQLITYTRWITLHEDRNVHAGWFERHALDKLRRAALAQGLTVSLTTFRSGPLTGFVFVPRNTRRRSLSGTPLGRWQECPLERAEVLKRTWMIEAGE